MTSRQIELVQSSFRMVQPILDDAMELFYERLFELDPSLRRLFKGSPAEQRRKLAAALTMVVRGIDRHDQIRAGVEELGRRHAAYGVRNEDYATVGAALLWTLQAGLGDAFTAEVRQAWTAAYGWLALTMQNVTSQSMAGTDAVAVHTAAALVRG